MAKNLCDNMSQLECDLVARQTQRRLKYREQFLKMKSDPHAHAKESGYIFDEQLQRFISLKVTHFNHFKATPATSMFGICAVVIPMVIYGCLIYNERNRREQLIRAGKVPYKDRLFKLQ